MLDSAIKLMNNGRINDCDIKLSSRWMRAGINYGDIVACYAAKSNHDNTSRESPENQLNCV